MSDGTYWHGKHCEQQEAELFRLRKERDDARNDGDIRWVKGHAAGWYDGVADEHARIIKLIETRRDATTSENEWQALHELRAALINSQRTDQPNLRKSIKEHYETIAADDYQQAPPQGEPMHRPERLP